MGESTNEGGAFGIKPFSAKVDLWLECPHGRISLAQVGPTFVSPAKPIELSPCDAVLVVSIDGEEQRTDVRLASAKLSDTRISYAERKGGRA